MTRTAFAIGVLLVASLSFNWICVHVIIDFQESNRELEERIELLKEVCGKE